MKKFTLGVIAGISTLALAVPAIAQVSSAVSLTGSAAGTMEAPFRNRPPLTQQQIQDMITKTDGFLTNIDALTTVQKGAAQTLKTALTAAASIADETERDAAVKKAMQDQHTMMQSTFTAHPELKEAMHPFGGPKGFGGHRMGRGPAPAKLAEKLGMTEAELKAAFESGKTIEQIATEKGITLPPRPAFGGRGMMHPGNREGAMQNSTSSL